MKKSIKIYLVGGAVRDHLLGRKTQDKDYVVVGATPNDLKKNGFIQVGKSFPVFLHPKTKEEYALARKEKKISAGHQGFEFEYDQSISLEEDLIRRDFTINAMAMDENENIIDLFNGKKDLNNKIIRHVSDHFIEDPLRVFRAARFASQLDFEIAPETIELMKKVSLSGELKTLSGERIFNEVKKSLVSDNPWRFWKVLDQCHALEAFFPELSNLKNIPQTKKYHPEGDVWIHTELVLKACAKLTSKVECRWASLTHDLGKALTPSDILPSHKGHEKRGLIPLKRINDYLKVPNSWKDLSEKVCEFHLLNHFAFELTPKRIYKLFKDLGTFRDPQILNDYLICNQADVKGRGNFEAAYPQAEFLKECFEHIQKEDYSEVMDQFTGGNLGEALIKKKIKNIAQFKKRYLVE